ncbi:hypothetical protein [Amycolatopsis sp. cmx-11-51]|uniref:hypothetical protein n=1 Tax=Amycolatopsis sp. cmx-11-51 TaxID=2785797 RepID=UPI0039E51563
MIRDGAGRLAALLKETSAPQQVEDAIDAAALMIKRPVAIAGLAALAGVAAATVASAIVLKQKRKVPECVTSFNDSLRAQLLTGSGKAGSCRVPD